MSRAMMVIINRTFKVRAALFGDAVLASAIIERLVHRASTIRIASSSYRIKGIVENIQLPDIKQQTQKNWKSAERQSGENHLENQEKKQRKSSVNAIDSKQHDNEN